MDWTAQDELNAVIIRVVVPAVRDHLDRVWQQSGGRHTWVEFLQERAGDRAAAAAFIPSDVRLQLDLLAIPEVATERFGLDEAQQARVRAARDLVDDLAGPSPAAVASSAAIADAFYTVIALLTALGLDAAAEQVREAEGAMRHGGEQPTVVPVDVAADCPAPVGRQLGLDAYVHLHVPAVYSYAQAHMRQLPVAVDLVDRPEWGRPGWHLDLALTGPAGPLGAEVGLPLGLESEGLSERERRALLVPLVDLRRLERLEDAQEAVLTAVLRRHGTEIARSATTLGVLAPRLWQLLAEPVLDAAGRPTGRSRVLDLSVETLASFVQPNAPAVAELAREASDLLARQGASGSLEGYQSGDPERVDQIARAIFEAMQARDIRYVEPPANWVGLTQLIRTPDEVLSGNKQGTCLDTTVAYAAALEFAGLHPLLWLADGHIFVGYWRTEAPGVDTSTSLPEDLTNYVDMRAIQLVETTAIAQPEPVDWEQMHRRLAQRFLHGGFIDGSAASQLIGDVHLLRTRDRIIPLPSRTRLDDGTVQVVEYTPQHSRPQLAVEERTPQQGTVRPAGPGEPARIEQWKNALLDLSLRNRLLNFPRSARFPLWVPEHRLGDFEDALIRGASVTLRPMDQVPATYAQAGVQRAGDLPGEVIEEYLFTSKVAFVGATSEQYTAALRTLARTARTIIEESGANNLYLSVGNLRWTSGGKELWSPLVLLPVTLRPARGGHLYTLSLDDTGTSTPNYSLLERLYKEHGLSIPGFAEPAEDGAGLDIDALFTAIRMAMTEARLPFTVEPQIDLAILQFGKFRLWKDLAEAWQPLTANPLVHHLVHMPTAMFDDPVPDPDPTDLDELTARLPVQADSSQARAIQLALAGRTLVIEGPPGTGKSQTITNLLARAMADGKKVLFVAEKQAALEVVSKRLDDVGVGPFVLNLHDRGQKPAAVKAKLRAALEYLPTPDLQGLQTSSTRMEQARRRLAGYRDQVHGKNALDLSAYTAHTKLLALGEVTPAPVDEDFVHRASVPALDALRRAAESISDLGAVLTDEESVPWQVIGRPLPDGAEDLFYAAATELDAAIADLTRVAPDLRGIVHHLPDRTHLQQLAALEAQPWMTWGVLSATVGPDWQQAAYALRADLAMMDRLPAQVAATYDLAVLHFDLAGIRQEWRAVEGKIFGGRQRRRVIQQVDRYRRPEATVDESTFGGLLDDLVLLQEKGTAVAQRVRDLEGLQLPPDWHPYDPEHRAEALRWLDYLTWVAQLAWPGAGPDLTRAQALLADAYAAPRPPQNGPGPRSEALARVEAALVALEPYVSPWEQGFLTRWTDRREHAAPAHLTPVTWRRWNDLLTALQPLADSGLHAAYSAYLDGGLSREDARLGLQSGLARAALGERMRATGLISFDRERHGQDVERFSTTAGVVRQQLRTVLPQEIVDRRTFVRSTGRSRIGELTRRLTGRKRVEIRALIAEYGDLITEITPCVLVSPDSAARFFPPDHQLFDLVVFDEASQIRVADAIGAMGRGRSAVVVGDSKQMPPTSIAEASAVTAETDEQTEVETVEDEESILTECIQAGVPRVWLSWHYRSQDESLIAFSNQQYYEGRLSSFPAPVAPGGAAGDGRGIRLVRVDGQFQREGRGKLLRTNLVEAQAVVDEIRRRFEASPESLPSLGVVTFNIQQRNLIENLLRDLDDERVTDALEDPEGVFVKNLENVQGDERDTILFSTGFSKNAKGVLPLNFGPLNRSGGERRLNVAITRARREVVIFSSFAPQDLRVEETSSEGLRDLRAYLEVAERGTTALRYRGGKGRVEVDRHRDEVAEALRARGLLVQTAVGLSDFRIDLVLAVPGPDGNAGRPLVAVLLDSVPWSQRATTGDRDALPVDVLGGMLHWPDVQRVWLPEWLDDSGAVVDRLVEATRRAAAELTDKHEPVEDGPAPRRAELDELDGADELDGVDVLDGVDGIDGGATTPSRAMASTPPGGEEDAATSGPMPALRSAERSTAPGLTEATPAAEGTTTRRDPDGRSAFAAWQVRIVGDQAMLNAADSEDEARAAVQQVAREIVDVEYPIREERLVSLTCAAFDLRRVRQTRRESTLDILSEVGFRRDADGFVWPADVEPYAFRGYRPEALVTAGLTIDDVHPQEMRNIASRTHADDPEELERLVLGVLGGKRLTEGIAARISAALQGAAGAR
ncbi:DUF4011 domain-containing protein [Raineyella sp. LH-20]|uniref:DUF4011 domain-containing protein n=1 Tax=Raineyella sp. LH-20 TaxID=3081204 RepID=UPI002955D714|nr:DUF4011 domain-containing protein [Raineyella sp. LH-20]WOP18813.1 DUF4011 domain-containing protein [Raineyella sp. LH-20]